MNELTLFAGAGGGILGGHLLGWRIVCAVEYDRYARDTLLRRQDDGALPPFPVWDDVRTFDGRPWRGIVDVVSGGFPCQDISIAGKGAGITGERSGLWREMARIIGEVRPRFALVENSPMLVSRGLGTVLGDLSEMGYDARWGVISAADAIWLGGTPALDHLRERIFIVATDAHARGLRCDAWRPGESLQGAWVAGEARNEGAHADGERCGQRESSAVTSEAGLTAGLHPPDPAYAHPGHEGPGWRRKFQGSPEKGIHWWTAEPGLGRVAHGVANRVDRLRCIGNGQVPAVVRLAWEILTGQWD